MTRRPVYFRGNQIDGDNPLAVGLSPDSISGELVSLQVTLSGTPGTVTEIALPSYARGVRLYPYTNGVRFAIDEAPAAIATSAATTIGASAFAVGGIAQPDQWEVRLLDSTDGHALQLSSADASTVVDIEVF